MHTVFKLALVFLFFGFCTTREIPPNKLLRNTERNLLQLMVDTRFEQRANPEQSLACFNYYLPLFDSLSEEYKENYEACLVRADEHRSQVDASTQGQRDAIESSANSSCETLKACSGLLKSTQYFGCFAQTGKENTEIMYEISANASETLAEVRDLYRLIENSENRCTNASERAYVEKTYQANLDLQSCLRGDIVPPTVEPSTEAPESTTAIVETSSEAPESTAVPVEPSSEAPESTTAIVGTSSEVPESTAVPVEPSSEAPESTVAPVEPSTVATEPTAMPELSSSEIPSTPTFIPYVVMPEEDLYDFKNYNMEKIRDSLRKYMKGSNPK